MNPVVQNYLYTHVSIKRRSVQIQNHFEGEQKQLKSVIGIARKSPVSDFPFTCVWTWDVSVLLLSKSAAVFSPDLPSWSIFPSYFDSLSLPSACIDLLFLGWVFYKKILRVISQGNHQHSHSNCHVRSEVNLHLSVVCSVLCPTWRRFVLFMELFLLGRPCVCTGGDFLWYTVCCQFLI